MATRLELRTTVRRRLEDTGTSPLWDDAALNDFLAEAMRRYATRFPKELSAMVTVAAGATSAVVTPAIEASQVVRVFDNAGANVPRQRALERDGAALGGLVTEQAWRWWNATLLLARAPAATGSWQIDYLGGRSLPSDDTSAVDLIAGDEDIVALLAAAVALRRRAVEDGKRGLGRSGAAVGEAARVFQAQADRLIAARRRRARGEWLS